MLEDNVNEDNDDCDITKDHEAQPNPYVPAKVKPFAKSNLSLSKNGFVSVKTKPSIPADNDWDLVLVHQKLLDWFEEN